MRTLMFILAAAGWLGTAMTGCDRVDSGANVPVDSSRPAGDAPSPTSPRTDAPADPSITYPGPLTPGTGATGTGVPRPSTTMPPPGTTSDTTPPPGTRPDNTAINQRDADMRKTKTPIDQNENQADVNITADIRKRILDQNLSLNANNVKVITADGKVTLRGPVNSQTEHDTIARIAREIAGEANVDNQLEVKP